MKIYAVETLKRNIMFAVFICVSIFFFISMSLQIKNIRAEKEPFIIAIDQNGTRIANSELDPIFQTEAVSFVSRFLNLSYNFTQDNFLKNMGLATSMLSEDLWKLKKSQILDLKRKVEEDGVELKSTLEKMTKDEHGKYFALLSAQEKSRLSTSQKQIKVEIEFKKTNRTNENPWGLEITSYEDALIR